MTGGAELTNWAHVGGGAGPVASVTGSRSEVKSGPIDGGVSGVVDGRGRVEAIGELSDVDDCGPADGAGSGVAVGRGGDIGVAEVGGWPCDGSGS